MPSQILNENSIPNFLLKLWKLVDDEQYRNCINWDESGFSFHVREPYTFSKTVLPLYFKHSNLNSFIRQLNMYGFRKVTSLDKGSMKKSVEQTQQQLHVEEDTLEFQHPHFIRGQPELLQFIKRKTTNSTKALSSANGVVDQTVIMDSGQTMMSNGHCFGVGASMNGGVVGNNDNDVGNIADIMGTTTSLPDRVVRDVGVLLNDVRQLKDKQVTMDARLSYLKNENESMWHEICRMRQVHNKQQQIVNKVIQLLLAVTQSNNGQRIGKRQLLAIGDSSDGLQQQNFTEDPNKRQRSQNADDDNNDEMKDLIESLQQESHRKCAGDKRPSGGGLSIADVTDEFDDRERYRNRVYSDSSRSNSPNGRRGSQQPTALLPSINQIASGTRSPHSSNVSTTSEWGQSSENSMNQSEFSDYLEYVQSDLSSLKTMLTTESFNVDSEILSNLFTVAEESNGMMAAVQSLKEQSSPFASTVNLDVPDKEMHSFKPSETIAPVMLSPTATGQSVGKITQQHPHHKHHQHQQQQHPLLIRHKPQVPLFVDRTTVPQAPPPLPAGHFFQRQSSVPAYYYQPHLQPPPPPHHHHQHQQHQQQQQQNVQRPHEQQQQQQQQQMAQFENVVYRNVVQPAGINSMPQQQQALFPPRPSLFVSPPNQNVTQVRSTVPNAAPPADDDESNFVLSELLATAAAVDQQPQLQIPNSYIKPEN